MPVGLVPVATYGDGNCFFGLANIFAYVTEDCHPSLRMAVMEETNVHAGYNPDVFVVRGPIAKTDSENAICALFGKPIFRT